MEEDALGMDGPDADDNVEGGSSEEWCEAGFKPPFVDADRNISRLKPSCGGASTSSDGFSYMEYGKAAKLAAESKEPYAVMLGPG